jgi:hypothetical protein
MQINKEEYIEFTDQSIVTILFHMGIKIDSINRTNPKRIAFIFKNSKKATQIIKDFYTAKLRVEPSSFLDDIKKVKSRIYQNINY